MENILELLNEKNRNLEKFYRINETELMNFSEGNFDHLEEFYLSREGLLKIIAKIDQMVEQDQKSLAGSASPTVSQKKLILKAFDYKNEIVSEILSQDLQILSFIEKEKSIIIKELAQVGATKKAVGAYQSGTLKQNQIDEKA